MSFAACRMMHWPTGIQNCASGFITHSPSDFSPQMASVQSDEIDADWISPQGLGPLPDLILTAGNVLEIFALRVQHQDATDLRPPPDSLGGGGGGGGSGRCMSGVSSVLLELVCHYKLHGNVESMAVFPAIGVDGCSRRRDSIMLTFRDAKISVLEFDDSVYELRTSSMHCFEGPDWCHLKRGRECFDRGPMIKVDPQGRCAGVLLFDIQMAIFRGISVGSGTFGEDDRFCYAPARVDSSYIFNLLNLDVKHVSDFVFLNGYIEPVIVVLHKRELTWAGLAACKNHTSMLSAISITPSLKQQTVIWSAANLPHDAYTLLAVPSPIGGVLVICANSVHYHTHSLSYTLQLNSFYFPHDGNHDPPRSSFPVELDAANATWLLNDVAIFSTKTGELLLLTVVYDGRSVQRLDISRSKGSVLTSGITTLGNSLFFLGSRLGDSLLVQYSCGAMGSSTSHPKEEAAGDIDGETHSAKRQRRSSSEAALQGMEVVVEELSLYSSSLNDSESAQRSFSFAVRDSLLNIGPLKDFTYSLRANADMNATGISRKSNYELVCCSGHGKNGALCIMQQSIRPEMITEVELPGCSGIWTVYYKNCRGQSLFSSSKIPPDQDEYHAYLIISMDTRTMVLETAEDLREVTEIVEYYVQGRTVSAGNLFRRRRVVQVFSHGARILDGSFLTQELSFVAPVLDTGSKISTVCASTASIVDPYVLVKMTDGTVRLLVGNSTTCAVSITTPSVFDPSKRPVSSCTLYHDKGPEPWLRKASTDAWLSTGISEPLDGADGSSRELGDVYCVVCYSNGALEIFDVPNFNSVFSVYKFPHGKSNLVDTLLTEQISSDRQSVAVVEESSSHVKRENADSIGVTELVMQRWEGAHSRPFLFGMLTDGTVLCYHAYLFDDPENPPRSEAGNQSVPRLRNLRFVRVLIENYSREESSSPTLTQRITLLTNVGGRQGLFLSGSRPTWVMVFRERLRVHPQLCDGPIVAFTVLHNVNCSHGFIYVTSNGFLKICQLPSELFYDNCWPVRKIPLGVTPHQITYIPEKNLYPLIVSFPVRNPVNHVLSLLDQDGQLTESENYSDDFHQMYSVEEFQVRIFEPEKAVGPWKERETIVMNSLENALTVRVVSLLNTTTKENQMLLAIGTAYVQGEDVSARGRVLLYSTKTNTDNPQNVVTQAYSKELKGAISALVAIQGHLLVAAGPKVILHTWSGTELCGVAFFDAPPLYVVSLNIVKNFILIGDVHKSIYFLSRKEHGSQLTLLAKDFSSLDCLATEFLIDGSTLSFVASDEQKNIQIFYYAPKMSESWKGQKLLLRAEFHVGAHVTKFLRLQMLSSSPDRAPGSEKTNKFALLFGTLDGGVGCIAPLDELTFRRLQSLQKKLVNAVRHVAGLNPRSFRQFWANGKPHRPGPDSVVDCELLSHYEMMPLDEQLEIAQQIGTTRSQIVSNLSDLSVGTSFL